MGSGGYRDKLHLCTGLRHPGGQGRGGVALDPHRRGDWGQGILPLQLGPQCPSLGKAGQGLPHTQIPKPPQSPWPEHPSSPSPPPLEGQPPRSAAPPPAWTWHQGLLEAGGALIAQHSPHVPQAGPPAPTCLPQAPLHCMGTPSPSPRSSLYPNREAMATCPRSCPIQCPPREWLGAQMA